MNKQKGQTLVEFAFVLPFFIFMFLSILYIEIMFLDYTQYSNAARDAARDISLQYGSWDSNGKLIKSKETQRDELVKKINNYTQNESLIGRYAKPITNLYSAEWSANFLDKDGKNITSAKDAIDVQVSIVLSRDDLPPALEELNILPRELKTISYKMKLEEPTVIFTEKAS